MNGAGSRGLCGLWFHSFTAAGGFEWQGRVSAQIAPDTYLVQLYEWVIGTPGALQLVSLDKLRTCRFYETDEAMRASYTNLSPQQQSDG